MDIERYKQLQKSDMEAGDATRRVSNTIKSEKISKQDQYDTTVELFKPTIDVQKSIDEKQNRLIEQLKKKTECANNWIRRSYIFE